MFLIVSHCFFPNRGRRTKRVLILVQKKYTETHTQSVKQHRGRPAADRDRPFKILRVSPSTLKKTYKKQHSRNFSLEKQMIFPLQYEISLFFGFLPRKPILGTQRHFREFWPLQYEISFFWISSPEARFRYTTTLSRVLSTSVLKQLKS